MTIGLVILGVVVLAILVRRFFGIEIHQRQGEKEFAPGKRLKVIRDVTRAEYPSLREDVPAGTLLFEYLGPTYGVISSRGTAVSLDGGIPFFELPTDALAELGNEFEELQPGEGERRH
jgi:hypothetical protein